MLITFFFLLGTDCISKVYEVTSLPSFSLGSPFFAKITDRSRVTLITDLTDRMDENGHLALVCGEETRLLYDTSAAGPGTLHLFFKSCGVKK